MDRAPTSGNAAGNAAGVTRGRAAIAGFLAGGLALGTGELLSGLSGRIPSLVTRVGDIVIDTVPGSIERWAIDTFGTNDKPALIIGITVISLLIGIGTGIAASRRFSTAWTVFAGFGLIGALAAGSDPQRGAAWGWLAAATSALVGVGSLWLLLRAAGYGDNEPGEGGEGGEAPTAEPESEYAPGAHTAAEDHAATGAHPAAADGSVGAGSGRRTFVTAATAAAALGVASPMIGSALRERQTAATEAERDRAAAAISQVEAAPAERPTATEAASTDGADTGVADTGVADTGVADTEVAAADGADTDGADAETPRPTVEPQLDISDMANFDDVEGLTPVVVPNDDFYRIDTALVVPRLDIDSWSMKITGMVDNELELTFDDLLGLDPVEAFVTLSCVSNPVGGDLVGNARWLGVPIKKLLDMAGVQPGATQIVGRSVDGWTGGFPTEYLDDPDRVALVAVAMNGEPLPIEHGFPVRLVVAGLYGYVSATKWLQEIELTTWEGFDGYWIPRGWGKLGPIKTQSRIDVPRSNSTVTAGAQPIAGVAWAPDRGIDRVEVQVAAIVDNEPVPGEWRDAQLSADITDNSWRQWYLEWDPGPGDYLMRVRATDSNGEVQTEERASVAPDGATGWHTIAVRVN